MARKHHEHVITTDDRDKGKRFLITEMSSYRAEAWAMRTLMALFGANVDIPEGFGAHLGMAGLAQMGMQCFGQLKWDVAEPLLKEMMDCIQIVIDPRKIELTRPIIDGPDDPNGDIEEVSTRLELRVEVWKLHMDFLRAVAPSLFEQAAAVVSGHRRNTPTSHG